MIIPCILLEEYLIILEEGVVELVLRNTWSSQLVLSKENRPFRKRSIPDSVSFVGCVCWFSSLHREVFLRVLRFSSLLENLHLT